MHPSFFVTLLGIAVSLISWTWFRHPGQSLWFYGLVWRASEYLNKTGARLWVIGSIVSLSGLL